MLSADLLKARKPRRCGNPTGVTSRPLQRCRAISTKASLVSNQRGEVVVHRLATAPAPAYNIRRARLKTPMLRAIGPRARLRQLLSWASGFKHLACAVAHPCDADALGAVLEDSTLGLVEPILLRPRARVHDQANKVDKVD
jgi:phosphate acetyltransferase